MKKFSIAAIVATLCLIAAPVFAADKLSDFDAVIATGSNNTSNYFEYYFGKYPHIIRKNRTSVAILTGKESKQDLISLGKDVFLYFGLGCRNVSKLLVLKIMYSIHYSNRFLITSLCSIIKNTVIITNITAPFIC